MGIKKTPTLALVTAGVLAMTTRDAAAYIDPGSGSYLFQILIAGFTALVFFFSTIKRKVAQSARALFGSKEQSAGGTAKENAATSDTLEVAAPREP